MKDSRKDFEKISDDLDSALNRNSNVPRTKVQECEEAKNILTSKRSGFAHASLDYVFQVRVTKILILVKTHLFVETKQKG